MNDSDTDADTTAPDTTEGANAEALSDNAGGSPILAQIWRIWVTYGELLRSILMLAVFCAALWLLHHEFKTIRYDDVVASFRSLPVGSVVAAIVFTAANFVVLIGYDWFGVRMVSHPVPGRQLVPVSLVSHAFSNSLGAYLGGAPVRLRLYSDLGMPPAQIGRLLFMINVAFWMGLFCLAGLLFVWTPFDIPARFHLPVESSRPVGIVLLISLLVFLLICHLRRAPLPVIGINLQPPPLKIALAQMLVAMGDLLLAASVLYFLLPQSVDIAFLHFVAIFTLALTLALVSHVPGGLGVLELVLLTMLPGQPHALIGSLVAFRIVYYLVPLVLALIGISLLTMRRHGARIADVADAGAQFVAAVGPRIVTLSAFIAGATLLVSGTLPVPDHRIDSLQAILPLPAFEISHFLGSIAGAMLLVVACGLQDRVDAAYRVTLVLLGAGAVLAVLNGLHYAVAGLLVVLLLALLPCRAVFDRSGQFLAVAWTPRWLLAVGMLGGSVIWLILFAYQHVQYSHELWWTFEYHGQASRSLRAAVGAAIVVALYLAVQLLRPVSRNSVPPQKAG